MRSPSTGGRGSNQYATKPGATAVLSARADTQATAAAVVDEDAEAAAWAFHPDGDRWAACGMGSWEQAGPWVTQGVSPADAAPFQGLFVDVSEVAEALRTERNLPPEALAKWYRRGFTTEEIAQWRALNVEPGEAFHLTEQGVSPERVNQWWDETLPGWRDAYADAGVWEQTNWVEYAGVVDPFIVKACNTISEEETGSAAHYETVGSCFVYKVNYSEYLVAYRDGRVKSVHEMAPQEWFDDGG